MSKKLAPIANKKKNYRTLRNFFAAVIFAFMLLSLFISSFLIIILNSFGVLRILAASPVTMILIIFFISICIATVLAYYVNTQILAPIVKMSEASKEVARGNFGVRIDENTNIEELDTTFSNFNKMAKELGSIETLRDDFVANVSHEFKTPLSAIEGYTMLLQDETQTEQERRECISKILSNTKRLTSLAENILLISKLDNQNFTTEKSLYRLDEQLREAILAYEDKWTKKSLELDIELDEVNYFGVKSLMMQVWLNLIGNAIKFTDDNGHIGIRLIRHVEKAEIIISDNGIGMSEKTRMHVFEKFYQGDTSHKSEGNGLGLALCKKILDKSGAQIRVESEPGEGTQFTVFLPLENDF